MSDIWFISDTHFQHENILSFEHGGKKLRPEFSSAEEMDEVMIERWNSVVKPGDIVYHLGDVIMGDRSNLMKIMNRLNGKKRLVVGNHDDIKFICASGAFQKVQLERKFDEFGLLCTHRPAHEEGFWDFRNKRELINVHGHIHTQLVLDEFGLPDEQYKNICVELTNYTPVSVEELRIY
jgi:calcineurin-like phosphoesterase family protein